MTKSGSEKQKIPLSNILERRMRFDPLFLHNLRMLLTIVTVLMLSLAMTLFISFERISRRRAYDQALEQLEQTAVSTADLVETIQQITFQIQQDSTISPILLHNQATSGEKAIAIQQLSRYQYIIQSLSSIYIYNGRTNTWYTSCAIDGYNNQIIPGEAFPDQTAVQLVEEYLDYQAYRAVPRKFGSQSYYTFLGYGLTHKGTDGNLNCAVLVNVSASWLSDVIGYGKGEGETIVMDNKGCIFSDSPRFPMQSDFAELLPEAADIIHCEKAGFMLIKSSLTGERCLLTYTAPDNMGWQYIRLIPYRLITKSIDRVRDMTVLILFIFLMAGLGAGWFLSRLIYRPIDEFKESISRLENNERENFFTLRNTYLRTLLYTPPSGADLSEKIKEYGLHILPDRKVIAAYLRADHRADIQQISAAGHSALLYAVINIACEVADEMFAAEGIDMQNGQIALILSASRSLPSKEQQQMLFARMIDMIESALSLSISIGVSDPGEFSSLPALFESAKGNWFQRLFTGDHSIIIGSDKNRITDYRYPEKKEKALADALMHGSYEKACALYLEIIEECTGAPLYVVNTTVLRLASMCNQTAANFPAFKEACPFFINLSLYESVDQLNRSFYSFFRSICDAAIQQTGGKNSQLAEAVNREIAKHFSDPSLSVDSLADTLGLSASYLGRVYKTSTGRTILDFILETRMSEARRLLKESPLSISEIARQCGFSSDSYFYKLFRQEHGMTPAAYRKAK